MRDSFFSSVKALTGLCLCVSGLTLQAVDIPQSLAVGSPVAAPSGFLKGEYWKRPPVSIATDGRTNPTNRIDEQIKRFGPPDGTFNARLFVYTGNDLTSITTWLGSDAASFVGNASNLDDGAIRFRGFINVTAPGIINMGVNSDDGSRITIAGRDVAERDGSHGDETQDADVNFLGAGLYPIEITYFNGDWTSDGNNHSGNPDPSVHGGANFRLRVAGANITATDVARLFVAENPFASVVELVTLTNTTWRYFTNIVDPGFGDAWIQPGFNDSSWPQGRGLFGVEPSINLYRDFNAAYPSCFCDQGTVITPPGSGGGVSTFFRTRFNWTAATQDVVFTFTNYVDDSLVVWLNGVELFRFNVTATKTVPMAWNDANPSGTANPLGEGVPYITNLVAASIRSGENVLAVQLQQQGTGSSDDVFTMSLKAVIPSPVFIVTQPASVTIEENRPASFTVGWDGTAPQFQWFKGGTAIEGATSQTYSISNAVLADAGNYTVVVSNPFNSVTSAVAVLTVLRDTNAPAVVSVVSLDGKTVNVTFNEKMDPSGAGESLNYTIDGIDGAASSATLLSDGFRVVLGLGPDTTLTTNFTFSVTGLSDVAGNPIREPNSATGAVLNLIPMDMGAPNAPGSSFAFSPTEIEVIGGGADIWGTSDQGHLLIGPRTGNFDIQARVSSLTRPDAITKAGLMVRESFEANAPNLYLNVNPANGRNQYELGRRTNTMEATGAWGSTFTPAGVPNAWMRIQRFGNTFTGYRSSNGVAWVQMGQVTVNYTNYLVGFAVTAHNNTAPAAVARFSNFGAFSYSNASITITQQPANLQVANNNVATFTVGASASNAPANELRYQWQTEETANVWTNIPNANGASFVIDPATMALSGRRYRVIVSVPGASVTSSPATLSVGADTVGPLVTTARGSRGLNAIRITFNERVSAATATAAGSYSISNAAGGQLTFTTATLSADERTVTLATAAQTPGAVYNLRVSGVTDLAGNVMTAATVAARAWVYTPGFVLAELYTGIGGGTAMADLRGAAKFPDAPDIVRYPTAAALNAADELDNYGARISGAFIPPQTGNYTFYFASDDQGELWLSTDENPANILPMGMIAREPVWSGRRTWVGEAGGGGRLAAPSPSGAPANIATNVNLTGGRLYYFEGLMKEGIGGDNVDVYVQFPGTPVPANGAASLSGQFTAALADPVGASVTITEQPASVTINAGTNTTLSVRATGVMATGPGPLAYRWQRLVGGVFTDVTGGTSSNYVTANLTASDNGAQFRALVFTPGASATSSVAVVTVGGGGPSVQFASGPGGVLNLSWPPGFRLQCTASLTPPIVWRDVTPVGVTNYTVNPSNEFDVNLDPAQDGGGARTGIGSGTVTLVSNNTLAVDVTYSGLSGTNRSGTHFHAPAGRGTNAPVVYDLGSITTGNSNGTIRGNVTLLNSNPAYPGRDINGQIQDLRRSLWYINVHTLPSFAGGEIRGQVEPARTRFYRLISP